MQYNTIEIMLHGTRYGEYTPDIAPHPGISLLKYEPTQNPNYLYVTLHIAPDAKPTTIHIHLRHPTRSTIAIPYQLNQKSTQPNQIQGLSPKDVIYLAMPDRFANGDSTNDSFNDLQQRGIQRNKMFFRHGGDIQGIINHLDYLSDLGISALWLNPLLENNQPYESYHGYAFTDHYQIDKRFGSNQLYKKLTDLCHQRGIKIIMDVVHNHVGDQHWLIKDLPETTWIHQYPQFTRTTYREPTLFDPYAATADSQLMSNGWFDVHMPDLNQQNPHVAKYLIQNNLWWVQYLGLDAYRIDTYAYPDQDFMAQWGKALQTEYPTLHLFAETWVHGTAVQAQFTQDNNLRKNYNSYMPAVTDFQLYYAINEALSREQGWTEGVMRIYYTLAQDFLYADPFKNVTFLDNHDLSRFYSMVNENYDKYIAGINLLLTLRGIPQIYYGTEILLKNYADPDGKVRQDFPGGWPEDTLNLFDPAQRKGQTQQAYNYLKTLIHYRNNTPALHSGKLKQFVPTDGLYTYFRYNDNQTIMVVINTSKDPKTLELQRFAEVTAPFTKATHVVSGNTYPLSTPWQLAPYESRVLELSK